MLVLVIVDVVNFVVIAKRHIHVKQ